MVFLTISSRRDPKEEEGGEEEDDDDEEDEDDGEDMARTMVKLSLVLSLKVKVGVILNMRS